ncbi:MAG: carboxypeptidase regulatory-like domain-containing protein [Flavobacteriales bacterium]|nr:carboxypeptidase regulatory-like domain-containing protein [Flavobacteriales bacterium]
MKTLRDLSILVALSVCNLAVQGQAMSDMIKGDKAFDKFDYEGALYYYELVNEVQKNDPAVARKIADAYRRMGNLPMSAEWYKITLENDQSNPEDMIHYAEALKSLGVYDEALAWYGEYSKFFPNDRRAKSHLARKNYYLDLQADSMKYVMKRMEINNADPAIGISRFENGKYLISSMRIDKINGFTNPNWAKELPYLDVYSCDLNEKDELINAVRLDKNVNSKYHDGPAHYCRADKTLYITRNNMRGSRPVRDKMGNVNLQIYAAKYDNGTWKSAQELKFNKDDYSNGHPCISRDGNFMYFASNMPGGVGGADIYLCQRIGDGWSVAVNMGSAINTEGDEMFPYMTDNGVLYFSSNGWAGLGGLDIFRSDFLFGKWMDAVNLGFPINSSADDFSMLYDNMDDSGLFCSSRDGGGNDDVYSFHTLKLLKMIVAGTVQSNIAGQSLAGEAILIASANTGKVERSALNDKEQFEFEAEAGDRIEIRMENPIYETTEPVFTYYVSESIVDPYENVGEKMVTPRPMDAQELQRLLATADAQLMTGYFSNGEPVTSGKPVSGMIVDKVTMVALEMAAVTIETENGEIIKGYTDENGNFRVMIPKDAKTLTMTAVKDNFITQTKNVDASKMTHDVTRVEMKLLYTEEYAEEIKNQVEVSGKVTDAETGMVISRTKIVATMADGEVIMATTDANGEFRFNAPRNSDITITTEKKDYDPVQLKLTTAGQNLSILSEMQIPLKRPAEYVADKVAAFDKKNMVEVSGTVSEASDNSPVYDAAIEADVMGKIITGHTDASGLFRLKLPANAVDVKLTVKKKDFNPVTRQINTSRGGAKDLVDINFNIAHTEEYNTMVAELSQDNGMVDLSGKVVDMETASGIANATVTAFCSDGKTYSTTADADGNFTLNVPKNMKMNVSVTKDDYKAQTMELNTATATNKLMNDITVKLPHTEEYHLRTNTTLSADKKLAPGFENMIDLHALDIQNVMFDYDKAFIRDDSKPVMDQLAKIMKEQPTFNLVIRTHCDARGSIAYNQQLSMSRSMAVKGYLTQKGVNNSRIKTEWFGEAKPLNHCVDENSNCTEQEFELNRRAEFKLVTESLSEQKQ